MSIFDFRWGSTAPSKIPFFEVFSSLFLEHGGNPFCLFASDFFLLRKKGNKKKSSKKTRALRKKKTDKSKKETRTSKWLPCIFFAFVFGFFLLAPAAGETLEKWISPHPPSCKEKNGRK
jgi:Na+/H+ antiporter NhaD/arsenite permease-like protein